MGFVLFNKGAIAFFKYGLYNMNCVVFKIFIFDYFCQHRETE